jgi:hypothetical protein
MRFTHVPGSFYEVTLLPGSKNNNTMVAGIALPFNRSRNFHILMVTQGQWVWPVQVSCFQITGRV